MDRRSCVNVCARACVHARTHAHTHAHKITAYSFCIKSNLLQHWHIIHQRYMWNKLLLCPNFEFWILMHSSLLLIRFASFLLVPLNKTKHSFSPHSKWQSIIFMAASGWYEILLFISVCFLSLKNWFTKKEAQSCVPLMEWPTCCPHRCLYKMVWWHLPTDSGEKAPHFDIK